MEPMLDSFAVVAPLLLEQYRTADNLRAVLAASCAQADQLDQAALELGPLLDIDAAEGVVLDMIGRIVMAPREGRSDVDYRVYIKSTIGSSKSGTPDQILASIENVTGTVAGYIPEYPAGFILTDTGSEVTQELVDRLAPAGVQAFSACALVLPNGEPLLFESATGYDRWLIPGFSSGEEA